MTVKQTISMGRVLIVGGGFEYVRMMHGLGYTGAQGIKDAEIVLFTGGEDVDPTFYNEAKLTCTHSNPDRDKYEANIYHAARERNIPMVGICRGGQFLNVMNGGTLWQDVNNHCRNHIALRTANTKKLNKPQAINVTSTHHQMMRPTDKALLLLVACESTERMAAGVLEEGKGSETVKPDVEVCFYPETNSLCFQPHPEFANAPPACLAFFEECLDHYIIGKMPLPAELRKLLEKGI